MSYKKGSRKLGKQTKKIMNEDSASTGYVMINVLLNRAAKINRTNVVQLLYQESIGRIKNRRRKDYYRSKK